MNNFDIIIAWAFDGSGNNWAAYHKGHNEDGKALENGLFKGGHAYGCPGDLQGIEAEKAIKTGKTARNATKKGKGQTFASQDFDSVVNDSTDTTGLKAMKGVEVVAIAPVDTTITKEWDAEATADAVKTRVATFGKVSYGVKGTTTSKKIAYKKAALDKALNAAFTTRVHNDDALSLDTSMDSDWTPISADPMDALIEEENETKAMIAKAKAAVTSDEWAMVLAKANGATQAEMAETFGFFDNSGVSKKFMTIYKKVNKATGVAFVA